MRFCILAATASKALGNTARIPHSGIGRENRAVGRGGAARPFAGAAQDPSLLGVL